MTLGTHLAFAAVVRSRPVQRLTLSEAIIGLVHNALIGTASRSFGVPRHRASTGTGTGAGPG